MNTTNGEIVAGGNGQGNRLDQLDRPTDVVIDKKSDTLIICDNGNDRLIRVSHHNRKYQPTIILNSSCNTLAIDNNGILYIADTKDHSVKQWREGELHATIIIAGGIGETCLSSQSICPDYLFVVQNDSVYISNSIGHRVLKWIKDVKEPVFVAGGRGLANDLKGLFQPKGLFVDQLSNIYVVDRGNHRVMRFSKGSREGRIVVGGYGRWRTATSVGNTRRYSIRSTKQSVCHRFWEFSSTKIQH